MSDMLEDIKTHLEMMLCDEMKFHAGIQDKDDVSMQVFRLIQGYRLALGGVTMHDIVQPKTIKISELTKGMMFMGKFGLSTVMEVRTLPIIAGRTTYLVNTTAGPKGQYFDQDADVVIYVKYSDVVKE